MDRFKKSAIVVLFAASVGMGNIAQAELLYNITDLGNSPGRSNSGGWGINASGQVTGYSYVYGANQLAFITTPSGKMNDLLGLGEGVKISV